MDNQNHCMSIKQARLIVNMGVWGCSGYLQVQTVHLSGGVLDICRYKHSAFVWGCSVYLQVHSSGGFWISAGANTVHSSEGVLNICRCKHSAFIWGGGGGFWISALTLERLRQHEKLVSNRCGRARCLRVCLLRRYVAFTV